MLHSFFNSMTIIPCGLGLQLLILGFSALPLGPSIGLYIYDIHALELGSFWQSSSTLLIHTYMYSRSSIIVKEHFLWKVEPNMLLSVEKCKEEISWGENGAWWRLLWWALYTKQSPGVRIWIEINGSYFKIIFFIKNLKKKFRRLLLRKYKFWDKQEFKIK